MRILQVAKYPPSNIGGIEKLVKELCINFEDTDLACDVICFNKINKSELTYLKESKIYKCSTLFNIFSTPISFSFFKYLASIINNYDIIHIHLPNPTVAFYLLFLNNKKLYITTHFHADVSNKIFYFIYKPLEKIVLKRCRKIITTTISLSNCKTLKDLKPKINVIPSYLNTDDYGQTNNQKISKNLKKFAKTRNIIFIGRFTKYKNIPMLIKSFSKLKENINLLIIGSGSDFKLQSLIKDLKLSSRIKILKNLNNDEKRFILDNALFSVLPSSTSEESYGYTQIESMARGKPVISFDIKNSGVGEINKNDTGILLKVKNSLKECQEDLTLAMKTLIENKELLEDYSKNALNESKKYKSEKIFKLYRKFFKI